MTDQEIIKEAKDGIEAALLLIRMGKTDTAESRLEQALNKIKEQKND